MTGPPRSAHLQLLLACFRASPSPMRLPEVTGCPFPEVLAAGIIDPEVFCTGYAIMATRYEQFGIRALLPLDRVWAGTCSAARPGLVYRFASPGARVRVDARDVIALRRIPVLRAVGSGP